jgi:hypothetical protein
MLKCLIKKIYKNKIKNIVDIEWHAAKGATAQYQVVTQLLVGESTDTLYKAYAITDILHEMIRDCPSPHKDAFLVGR